MLLTIARVTAWSAAAAWIGLAVARGRFWDSRADRLQEPRAGERAPHVHAIVPARNEADVIARTLGALLSQDYPGRFDVTVVDDRSDDGTGDVARGAIVRFRADDRARVLEGTARPEGWSGKVWAMAQGVRSASAQSAPEHWWFTDADVEHAPDTLARLVATMEARERDLVSQMVALHCRSGWERLLIPAFVLFFRMLYPFAWVNDDRRKTAAAAGGCVLLRATMLRRIGGVERIRGELIDDCALAAAVKAEGGGLWLGLSTRSRSVRPYASLDTIWSMVARTAYTQLRYSPVALAGTVAGMLALYAVPPLAVVGGVASRRWDLAVAGAAAWGIAGALYVPTLSLYRQPRWNALALPAAALLYMTMTVDSARRHARGSGGEWKGRSFTAPAAR